MPPTACASRIISPARGRISPPHSMARDSKCPTRIRPPGTPSAASIRSWRVINAGNLFERFARITLSSTAATATLFDSEAQAQSLADRSPSRNCGDATVRGVGKLEGALSYATSPAPSGDPWPRGEPPDQAPRLAGAGWVEHPKNPREPKVLPASWDGPWGTARWFLGYGAVVLGVRRDGPWCEPGWSLVQETHMAPC